MLRGQKIAEVPRLSGGSGWGLRPREKLLRSTSTHLGELESSITRAGSKNTRPTRGRAPGKGSVEARAGLHLSERFSLGVRPRRSRVGIDDRSPVMNVRESQHLAKKAHGNRSSARGPFGVPSPQASGRRVSPQERPAGDAAESPRVSFPFHSPRRGMAVCASWLEIVALVMQPLTSYLLTPRNRRSALNNRWAQASQRRR